MKASDIIKKLEAEIAYHGDLECIVRVKVPYADEYHSDITLAGSVTKITTTDTKVIIEN